MICPPFHFPHLEYITGTVQRRNKKEIKGTRVPFCSARSFGLAEWQTAKLHGGVTGFARRAQRK
jgi:hypothetical protein